MLKLSYDAVHRFVEGYDNAKWDGWDVLLFKPTPAGATHKRGVCEQGQWGIQTRVAPDTDGLWRIRV
jgi:hypothetical protein